MISRAVAKWVPTTFDKVATDDKLRRFAAGVTLSPEHAHYFWRSIFGEAEKVALLRPEVYAATEGESGLDYFCRHFRAVESCDFLDRAMYVDIKTWLAHDILHKVDRASMAHSLEVRTPFLDHTLVEFAASLPVPFKIKGRKTKYLLRRSHRATLPRSITAGPKRGFNAPMAYWLTGHLRNLAQDVLFGSALDRYVRRETVEALWQAHQQGRRDNSYRLFGLLCLGLWLEQPIRKVQ
jgi:asparagine synthase (glutamine-hydrolysing)